MITKRCSRNLSTSILTKSCWLICITFLLLITNQSTADDNADPDPTAQRREYVAPQPVISGAESTISFYGQRGMQAQNKDNASKSNPTSKPSFHRRVIAPPILDSTQLEHKPQTHFVVDAYLKIYHMPNTNKAKANKARSNKASVESLNTDVDEVSGKEPLQSSPIKTASPHVPSNIAPPLSANYELTRNEKLLAKKAQFYFERNRRDKTALWDSVQGYSHTTMWDIASGIAATLALEALELRDHRQTRHELEQVLTTLQHLPLFNGDLPNREYSTKTAKPSGRLSNTSSNGNGWSALDIGRLLIWLKILVQQHPELEAQVQELIDSWNIERITHNGTLFGVNLYKGREHYRQEGRNGYLQYASEGFKLFDFEVPLDELEQHLQYVSINGVDIEIDTRNVPFLTTDPYVLSGLEYGIDPSWNQIEAVFLIHKKQSLKTKKLYSFSEDAMNKNPWFAYNNLYYYGKPWTSVSPSGKVIENQQIFSYKVAFGMGVIFDDAFSQKLYTKVIEDSVNYRAIPTGIYADGGSNSAFNINTNSLILVALWYKKRGNRPILSRQ